MRAHWQLKLLLTVVINVGFWAGYGWLGRNPVFPPWMPPRVWLDTAIAFQPEPWAWVYLSQFLFTGGLPWLIDTQDGVRRYSVGLVAMSAASFAVFLFLPVASPRPSGVIAQLMAWALATRAGGGGQISLADLDASLPEPPA